MRRFEKHQGRRATLKLSEPLSSVIRPSRNKSVNGQRIERKARRDRRCQRGTGSRNRVDRYRMLPTGSDECNAGIGDAWRPGVADERHARPRLKLRKEGRESRAAVVFVEADRRRRDRVMREKLRRSARIFGGNQVYFAQDAKRPKSDVLEVADGRGDDEQRAGHRAEHIVPLRDARSQSRSGERQSRSRMYLSEPFPHFVDDYLAYLHEVLPSQAALDGLHQHDDLLEDLSRPAVDTHVRALAGFGRRLQQIEVSRLPANEQIEHSMVAANIDARIHDLETVRSWERNPQVYSDALGTGLAGQALFGHAPEAERARRIVSKLRQAPRLVQAARDNIQDPAGIFVKVGLETWRGTLKFIEADLPKAFSRLDDLHILGDLADASTEAAQAIGGYVGYLETDVAPRARGSFRLGRDAFEKKLKLDEGVTLGADRLLAIALRELHEVQEEFRSVAGRVNGGDPAEVWRTVKASHPKPGQLVATAQEQLTELLAFLQRQAIVSVPGAEPVVVAPSPEFYRWAFASMWTPGPFEKKLSRACYYLTDVDPSWSPERQEEHMRDFNVATLWNISIHEVYPGHFLHFQHLRRVESKVRKSLMFAPASFVEGWAHYCEHMMVEAGFRRGDTTFKLGQLAEALVRLARFVVAIRLHCEDLSVEQGMRFFRDEAFLEEATARREAERGTFDPTYLVYSIGKLMMLKLRRDYQERHGGKFSLRVFHDAVLAQGNAPFWAHRRLLLDDATGAVLE